MSGWGANLRYIFPLWVHVRVAEKSSLKAGKSSMDDAQDWSSVLYLTDIGGATAVFPENEAQLGRVFMVVVSGFGLCAHLLRPVIQKQMR